MALMLEGNLPESVAEARETLRLFPGHTSPKFQLAPSLTKNHQYEEAVPAIRDAIAALPNFSPLHKFLGICLFQTKHTAEAIRELSWYVNADPGDAEGHYYLGSALRAAGREEEAKAQFSPCASQTPVAVAPEKRPLRSVRGFAARPADLLFCRSDVGNWQIPMRHKDLEAALLFFLIAGLVGIELFDQRFLIRIGGCGES